MQQHAGQQNAEQIKDLEEQISEEEERTSKGKEATVQGTPASLKASEREVKEKEDTPRIITSGIEINPAQSQVLIPTLSKLSEKQSAPQLKPFTEKPKGGINIARANIPQPLAGEIKDWRQGLVNFPVPQILQEKYSLKPKHTIGIGQEGKEEIRKEKVPQVQPKPLSLEDRKISLPVVDTQELGTKPPVKCPGSGGETEIGTDLVTIPEIIIDPRGYRGSIAQISPEGPVYVLVEQNEKLDDVIAWICATIWRVKLEGLPDTRFDPCLSEQTLDFRIERRDLIKVHIKSPKDIDKFAGADRMSQLRMGGLRFIILSCPSEAFEGILEKLACYRGDIPQLFTYQLKELTTKQNAFFARACWGLVNPVENLEGDLGTAFKRCANDFILALEDLRQSLEKKIPSPLTPKPDEQGGEKYLHYLSKWIVLHHLRNSLNISLEAIEYEKPLKNAKPKPDIYVCSSVKEIAVEIETLYGRGDVRAHLIHNKLESYRDHFKGELWIIIPNLQALIFSNDLLRIEQDYQHFGLNVKFMVFKLEPEELQEGSLMTLQSLLKSLREHDLIVKNSELAIKKEEL